MANKKFERWFWDDDTPAWSRQVWRFLLVASVLLVLVLRGWLMGFAAPLLLHHQHAMDRALCRYPSYPIGAGYQTGQMEFMRTVCVRALASQQLPRDIQNIDAVR